VLLHELGHNLNLAHGGNEEVNLKPNYISVMNYLYLSSGITNLARKNRIDYSGTALPTLNENKLFEPSGVSDGLDFIHYFCPADSRPTGDCLTDGAAPSGTDVGLGLTDWNCDRRITILGTVASDVNGSGLPLDNALRGFNDWAALKFKFQDTLAFALGAPPTNTVTEMDFEAASRIPEVRAISIDIKPGSFPNAINLRIRGVTPVAILSGPDLDARDVIPGSVVFAHSSVLRHASIEDVNGDGRPDLVLQFDTQSLQLFNDSTSATLTGQTADGAKIAGVDSVVIVSK